jgi:hypothetical protein
MQFMLHTFPLVLALKMLYDSIERERGSLSSGGDPLVLKR